MSNGVIVYIGGFELPDKNAAAHRVLNNAKALRECGKRVVFIGIDKFLRWDSNVLGTRKIIQGFEAYAIPYPKSSKQWITYLASIDALKKVIETIGNVESIVFYNYQSAALFRAMLYCKLRKIKVLGDVTEWYSAQGNGVLFAIIKGLDTWFRMRVLQKHMDGLIVISRYLQNYYRNCKNVICIPALTDLSESKWNNGDNIKKTGEVLRIVYAGSPGSHKDHLEYLVSALMIVRRRVQIDIIGVTKSEYCKEHPEHVDYLNQSSSIVFHGRVCHGEALKYVKDAHFSCFFRNDERVTKAGFPTKFSEAISCGTPVITNRTSDLAEYIKNSENGIFVDSISVDSIASTIESASDGVYVDRYLFNYSNYVDRIRKGWL